MNRLLAYFVSLSAGAHLVGMAYIAYPTIAPLAGQVLTISLLAGPSEHSQTAETGFAGTAMEGKHHADTLADIVSRRLQADASLQQQALAPNADIAGANSLAAQAATPVNGSRLLEEVTKLLTANFVYPPIARKLGQQGRVVVTVNLGGEGEIRKTELFQSSGYRSLDQAALRSISGIGHAPQLAPWLNGRPASIRVPVIYRLAEA